MPLGHPTDQELILYVDGTTYWEGTAWSNLALNPNSSLQGINLWGAVGNLASGGSGAVRYGGLMFPESRNISAFSATYAFNSAGGVFTSVETSTDATSFINGNWTLRYNSTNLASWLNADTQAMRQPWVVDWQNVKAVRFIISSGGNVVAWVNLNEIHFWGNFSRSGLAFWDASLNQIMNGANFDFGDVAQGSITDRQFRIKNNYSQIANNVVITAPAGGVGNVLSTLQFSDGGAYANSITIASIAPGAISPIITARRSVSPTAPLVVGCARVTATAGSWT